MFVPSMIGILTISLLMFLYFKSHLPHKTPSIQIKVNNKSSNYIESHPLEIKNKDNMNWKLFKISIFIVVATRACFFALSPFGISTEWIGLAGATILIFVRRFYMGSGIMDIVKKTPWLILLFAFNMYVLVYGIRNIGLNDFIVHSLSEIIKQDAFNATFVMGLLTTFFSNIFNNLPAVMIGTLSIMDMNLNPLLLQITYLASVIGADIGSLLTPIGTLATLIWMFVLKEHSIKITWSQYFKVTLLVIPIGLIVSLLSLYLWVVWLF